MERQPMRRVYGAAAVIAGVSLGVAGAIVIATFPRSDTDVLTGGTDTAAAPVTASQTVTAATAVPDTSAAATPADPTSAEPTRTVPTTTEPTRTVPTTRVPTTTVPLPAVYEAEAAPRGGSRAEPVATASGGLVVAGMNDDGDWFEIEASRDAAGPATVSVRYSNATGEDRTLNIYRDGGLVQTVTFPPTAGESAFADVAVTMPLAAGLNRIGLVHNWENTGGIWVDLLSVA